jgi:TctA family transporter
MAETFTSLLNGFSIALTPLHLLWGFIGVMLGPESARLSPLPCSCR